MARPAPRRAGPAGRGGPAVPDPEAFTADILLSMALWKAVADRHDLLLATWDSGPGRRRPSASASPPWSGAGWTPASTRGWPAPRPATACPAAAARSRCRCPRRAGSPTPWPPRCGCGCRSTRRTPTSPRGCGRCGPRSSGSATWPRPSRPGPPRERADRLLHRLDGRVADLTARVQRGADVGGLLGPLEGEAARRRARPHRRAPSHRREDARDEARARALRTELEARGAALRDLAARCVAAVHPAPRLRRAGRRGARAGARTSPLPWTPTWPGWRPSAAR